MPKHQVNVEDVESVDLVQLQSKYEKLSASLEEVTRLAEALDADPTVGDQLLERRRVQIQDELHARHRQPPRIAGHIRRPRKGQDAT